MTTCAAAMRDNPAIRVSQVTALSPVAAEIRPRGASVDPRRGTVGKLGFGTVVGPSRAGVIRIESGPTGVQLPGSIPVNIYISVVIVVGE